MDRSLMPWNRYLTCRVRFILSFAARERRSDYRGCND